MVKKQSVFYLLLSASIISFMVAAFLMISSALKAHTLISEGKKMALQETKTITGKIEDSLKKLDLTAHELADMLQSGSLKDEALREQVKDALKKNRDILEITVACAPPAGESGAGLPAFTARLESNRPVFSDPLEPDEYTREAWFEKALAHGSPSWSEPYGDGKKNAHAVSYTIPFTMASDRNAARGVVRIAISLATIRDYFTTMELGHSIFRFIISRKGLFIYYPLNEVVDNQMNIFTLIKYEKNQVPEEKLRKALQGREDILEMKSPAEGVTYLSVYEPLSSTGWCLVSNYLKDDFTLSKTALRRQQIVLILVLIVFLTTVTALVMKAWELRKKRLWVLSTVFALLCLGGTCAVWHLVYRAHFNDDKDLLFLTDKVMLHKALAGYDVLRTDGPRKQAVSVPTGIFLETLEFKSANELKMVGYIWQKYARTIDPSIAREVTLPEATSLSLQEVYHDKEGPEEVIRWKFDATIREYFNYSKYPFDHPDMWIWLKHSGMDNRVLLIPDFGGYKLMSPAASPGLPAGGLVLPGYTLLGTYFSYAKSIATTDLGVKNGESYETFPELYYHVIARRNILNPFVSKIFPIVIMLSMLFVVILKFSNSEEEKKTFGISGLGVLGTVISFFFSTMVSQSALRTEMNVEKVTFLENFHLITYFMLFYMAVTTFFFIGSRKPTILEYEDCLLSKLLFWPLVTSLILLITIIYYF
jgi:hypothetical protein